MISVTLKRGSAAAVRQILREGPPFDLEQTPLERHLVFLTRDELVFLFEGEHAEEVAKRLLKSPRVLGQASRIGAHIRGKPRVPEEVYAWERTETLVGVNFGPYAGPGDSEGGQTE